MTLKEKTGMNEAIITGTGEISGNKVCIGIMDFAFMGGSMGTAIGEKVTRLIEKAIKSYRAAVNMRPDNDEYKLVFIQVLEDYISDIRKDDLLEAV